jgi:hypothetical protein
MSIRTKNIIKIGFGFAVTYIYYFLSTIISEPCKTIDLEDVVGLFGVSIFCSLFSFWENLLKVTGNDLWSSTVGHRSEYRQEHASKKLHSVRYYFINFLTIFTVAILYILLIFAINYFSTRWCI